ncbi:tetratricopeptide repeat protein [Niveispirillum lacus]|nr:tetratricopeptide repeat protein [Niveispirillum lacus]
MDRKTPPKPDSPSSLLDAAIASHQRGDLRGAISLYRKVREILPGNAEISHLLGLALCQNGQDEEGLRLVMDAAAAAPGSAAIQNNLGGLLMQYRQFAAAEQAFRAALAANPKLIDAWSNLAAVLLEQNRPDAAEKAARRALAADPARADAWSNLGVALLELGRFAEAEECQRTALRHRPDLAVAYANLGTLLRRRSDPGAVDQFRRAVDLDPAQPVARFNLSLDHLAQGRLTQGWTDYEERFRARQRQRTRELDLPFWQGQMLEGRHLLIWPEQGLGDEILFSSIFPDLKGLDGPVTVECEPRLLRLFARSFPHLTVAPAGSTAMADLQIAAGTLPRLARPGLSRFTGNAWLRAAPDKLETWRGLLTADGPALTVGFCWRSGRLTGDRTGFYPDLADFAPLFALPGIRWVPLQYDLDRPETAAELASGLPAGLSLYRPAIDLRDDIDGVAALIGALDLVISAATSVSELAGALGTPVWRIGNDDDWTRLGVALRPWYATMRCYTDVGPRPWAAVLAEMARDLDRLRPVPVAAADRLQFDQLHAEGLQLARAGRSAEAVGFLEQAAQLRPDDATLLSRLAGILRTLGRFDDACARYDQALAIRPHHAVTSVNLALCLIEQGNLDRAEMILNGVLARQPGMAHAHDALGLVWQAKNKDEAAILSHQAAVTADPTLLSGWVNMATALRSRHRFAEAVAALRKAQAIDPNRVEVWAGLGYALFRSHDVAGAEAALARALTLEPGYAPVLIDMSRIRVIQGRSQEALALLDQVLDTDPDNVLARANRAHLRLGFGDLVGGWADYRARFASGQVTPDRHFTLPQWQGENLAGRRLLVWREQGIGDEILFLSLIGDVKAAGAEIVVECDRRLTGLITRSFPGVIARPESDDPCDADFHCPMGNLPAVLRPHIATFRDQTPWMVPDPVRVTALSQRLSSLPPGLRVGFCWRSRDTSGDRAFVYLRLTELLPLLTLPGIVPISLQYDGAAAEIAELAARHGLHLHDFSDLDLTDDLETVAALVAGLDLVITAPTAIGEIAGALGVPVWRFQIAPDWSGVGTAVKPWFPTMRLFQSPSVRDTLPIMRRTLAEIVSATVAALTPPTTAPPPLELVLQQHQAGDLIGAEAGYRAILVATPDAVDAQHLLAQVLLQTGRPAEALPLVDRALALDPDFAVFHNTRGSILKTLGLFGDAERAFREALARRADYAEAWTNLGATQVELRRYAAAEKSHRRALGLRPAYPRALVNLGVVLRHLGRYREAAESHRHALNLSATMPEAWSDLGLCLSAMGEVAEAVACQERALAIDPHYAEAAVNLAMVRAATGDRQAARQGLAQALSIRPGYARALYNDGLLALSQGDFAAGWSGHEARFDSGEVVRGHLPGIPAWDGQNLAGRHLLVWREQGLGDEIMFATHYARLAGLNGRITLWAEPRLVPIFARALPFATVVAEGTAVAADCQVAAGSLPQFLAPDLAEWTGSAILHALPDRSALWRDRLAALPPGLRVGLCWRSHLRTADRDAFYTELKDWLPLLQLPGVQVVSLQYDGGQAEITALETAHDVRVHRWDGVDLRDDLETALALTAGLDLVISVATAVGEMAGALGVPVWRVSGEADWTRLGTAIRPWFAAMRVFSVPVGTRPAQQVPMVVRALSALRAQEPDGDPSGWLQRGIERQREGDPSSAIPFYRALIRRGGEPPEALHLLGLALQQTGHADQAESFMERAVAAAPDYTPAWVNLGNLRQELDRPVQAETAYRRALAQRPVDPVTWTNLGNALRMQGRLAEAIKAHQRAIAFDGRFAIAHANLAVALKDNDKPDQAVVAFRQALVLGGAQATTQAGLGDALRQMGDMQAAEAELRAALALDPQQAEAWNSLGRVAEAAGRRAEARRHFVHALDLAPGLASACYNLGRFDLAAGRLNSGWLGYGARFRATPSIRGRQLSLPVWQGQELPGKRLLVWGEQGLGDQLMFAALYPALIDRGAHLIMEVDPRLVTLFARAFPAATVRPPTKNPTDADYGIAAGDVASNLWRCLGDQMPAPYLLPREDLLVDWRDRLAALGSGLKIGVCWRSALMNADRQENYFPLADLTSLAHLPDVQLISLQRGDRLEAWDKATFDLHHFADLDLDDDLEGQAALIAALDLVITAPTAVGEMAGALGVPVWRLGPPDWTRLGTPVRPWFPTMYLPDQGQGMSAALGGLALLLAGLRAP